MLDYIVNQQHELQPNAIEPNGLYLRMQDQEYIQDVYQTARFMPYGQKSKDAVNKRIAKEEKAKRSGTKTVWIKPKTGKK